MDEDQKQFAIIDSGIEKTEIKLTNTQEKK